MNRRFAAGALAGFFALSTGNALAQAEGTDDTGGKVHLGLRVGYGLPLGMLRGESTTTAGNLTSSTLNVQLSDVYSGMIPIWLDAGYFVTPRIMVGLYSHYGIARINESEGCSRGFECSGSVIRLGVEGQYHLARGTLLDPWFGLGVGYEIASTTLRAGEQNVTFTAEGFELVNLQAGADFRVADRIGIGPFVSFSVGQYSRYGYEPDPADFPHEIENKTIHEWFVLGVHGAFGF